MTRRSLHLLLPLLLAGCHLPAPTAHFALTAQVPAASPVDPGLLAPPAGRRLFLATAGGGTLAGTVAFQAVSDPFFADNAATYGLLAMPSANALVTLQTLEGDIFTYNGSTIVAASDAGGHFDLANRAPTDRAFVVSAGLAQSHRLSALVLPGQAAVTVNEASSMVTELARWQLRATDEDLTRPTLATLTAPALQAIHDPTAGLPQAADFAPAGDVPGIEALRTGNGHALRNLYVRAFGAAIATGAVTPADQLSDAWKAALGFRPLAMTRVAGNGLGNATLSDGEPALETQMDTPVDAQYDAAGNLYITEYNSHLMRFIPREDHGPLLAWPDPMEAGHMYTVAGVAYGPGSPDAFNDEYQTLEADALADPAAAPLASDYFPIFTPYRLNLEDAGGESHLCFTSLLGQRIFFIPATDVTRFGRQLLAGRIYTLAGNGVEAAGEADVTTNHQLSRPTGLARAADGSLYFLTSGAVQGLWKLNAADGQLTRVSLLRGAMPFTPSGAQDVRLHDGWLYVADTGHHQVFRVAPGGGEIEVLLGQEGKPGFLDISQPDVLYPEIFDVSQGVARAQGLLNGPFSLDFDLDGNMLVADRGRVRLLEGDMVYTIAGGLATGYLEGDSRLLSLPSSTYLNRDAGDNFLLTDQRECIVRRLWTGRGSH
jgi:hypothetical protein